MTISTKRNPRMVYLALFFDTYMKAVHFWVSSADCPMWQNAEEDE
jgi:hypothetical protein